ncbi:MAG: hypothetical protein Q8M22_06660 [Actinomycetota bacterium]|nr:hypothetical protein [Actinomycetota bacterium]
MVVLSVVASCSVQIGGDGSVDRVGSFDYESDVLPLVDRVMVDGLGASSAAAFMELMPPGAATEHDTADALERIADALGAWSGNYTIDRHLRPPDTVYAQLGPDPIEVMEVYIDTTFANGPARVRIAVGDVDGLLQLIAWDVTASSPVSAADG